MSIATFETLDMMEEWLETYTLEEILEQNDVSLVEVLGLLYEIGLIDLTLPPL